MEIVPMSKKPHPKHPEEIAALKHLALQVAVQLPRDEGDALMVLDYVKTLVCSFLAESKPV